MDKLIHEISRLMALQDSYKDIIQNRYSDGLQRHLANCFIEKINYRLKKLLDKKDYLEQKYDGRRDELKRAIEESEALDV